MKKLNFLTKLLLLCIMIVGGTNGAWADTVLFKTNFTTAEGWTTEDIITSSTTSATRTVKTTPDSENTTTISFADYKTSNLSVTAGTTSGSLRFTGNNLTASAGSVSSSSPKYYMAIPVTGVVGGVVSVTYTTETSFGMYYTYDDGSEGTVVARQPQSSSGTEIRFTISGLTSDKVTIYLGTSGKSITSLTISTPELVAPDSQFSPYTFFKQSSSSVTAQTLISEASLPSHITVYRTLTPDNSKNNTSSVSTPIDFSSITYGDTYYRLRQGATSSLIIGGLSHIKSIRLYGNGSGSAGSIKTTVTKLSGTGNAMTVADVPFVSSQKTIVEYSTGDMTVLDGYDPDTYYLYTLTFTGSFSLWGLYVEVTNATVTYNNNGGSGTISNGTGMTVTLSDGTGFSAPSANYTFAGWNTDPHGTGTSYASGQTKIVRDLDLYAVWTQDGTIDDNGGTADGAYTATYNKASIEITTPPTSSGYSCTGYFEAGTGDDLVASTTGELQTSTSYTDASGYWTNTDVAPTLYAQWETSHSVIVEVNDDEMGSAEAAKTSLPEDETTTITASANDGYKFRSWSYSDGDNGASLSSTTDNPTTLTMGAADVTVTATFSALAHYTIYYNKGAYGSGDAIANGDKTEDEDFTLSSNTYSRAKHLQTGWALTDGGDKAYELGGSYTTNADLTLYPFWTAQYTITYDANGGSGSMSDYVGSGSVTLANSSYTKTGYTCIGWATSKDDADAGTVDYVNKAAYTLTDDVTLYAVWAENFCEMKPASSGSAISEGTKIELQDGYYGGTIKSLTSSNLSYTANGLLFQGSSSTKISVSLNDYMQPGTVITLTLYASSTGLRGLDIYSADGTKNVTRLAFTADAKFGDVETFQYTVTSTDELNGTNGFVLQRVNNIALKSITVTDCQPGGVISASGWNTYSSNKKLDLSTISGGTAYIATRINGKDYVAVKPCTDIVNAGTGLMIKGTDGDKFTINTTSSAATLSKTNLMQGLPNGGTVDAEDGNYVFGWPSSDATAYGFYYVNKGATLGIGKSYLHVDGGGSARLTIVFDEEETTGISASLNDKEQMTNDKVVYDLQGRKVAQPARGLYIVGGKKVIIK